MRPDVIGLDEVDEILAEMGISGTEVVGADAPNAGTALRQKLGAVLRSGVPRRQLVPNSIDGRPRSFPLGFTQSAGLADAGTDTLTAAPDRECMVRALHLQANSAAGALLYGLGLTSLKVQGRNSFVGGGRCPDFALRTWALNSRDSLQLGMANSNGQVLAGIVNDCGAAVDATAGALTDTTD